jgi:hypothetical protein
MSLEMAHKVILPPKKNYIPQFLKQRDINSYYSPILPYSLTSLWLRIRMAKRGIFLKISTPHSLMATCRINLISAESISLGSTFNIFFTSRTIYTKSNEPPAPPTKFDMCDADSNRPLQTRRSNCPKV